MTDAPGGMDSSTCPRARATRPTQPPTQEDDTP
jgi:hypothetical protein